MEVLIVGHTRGALLWLDNFCSCIVSTSLEFLPFARSQASLGSARSVPSQDALTGPSDCNVHPYES